VAKRDKKYSEYLQSEVWKKLKVAVAQRADGTCERCRINPGRDVHHKTYQRIYKEELSDLIFLCRRCHDFLEGHSNVDVAKSVDTGLLGLYGITYINGVPGFPERMVQYRFQIVRMLPRRQWLVQLFNAWSGETSDVIVYDENYLTGPDVRLFQAREVWLGVYEEYSAECERVRLRIVK
jgi:hypothetical protein